MLDLNAELPTNNTATTTRAKQVYTKSKDKGWIGETITGKDGKQYTKTPYWLNVRSNLQPHGHNLQWGIKEDEFWLKILLKATVEEVNTKLDEVEPYRYITQANGTDTDDKANAFLATLGK